MPDSPRTPSNGTGSAGRIRQRIGDPDARGRRQRTITWILLAAVGVLLVNAIIGENGYLSTVQARQEEAVLAHAVARVRTENQHLQTDRKQLQDDPRAIEEAARRELGMVRPGEAVVIVQKAPPVTASPAPAPTPTPAP